ncbi:hypothetical protein HMPREF9004_0369 [Schaalia cardiffensis F0333]|uniref:Uncharacterized protein n=1 Tax=Schaalia cardiffensis F0333 TaxID=888050 RepID=N6WFL6_9ACTO|nr:hypothetical protein HMPREF9004_0369 [Schaalia cardiffensis F0333]
MTVCPCLSGGDNDKWRGYNPSTHRQTLRSGTNGEPECPSAQEPTANPPPTREQQEARKSSYDKPRGTQHKPKGSQHKPKKSFRHASTMKDKDRSKDTRSIKTHSR